MMDGNVLGWADRVGTVEKKIGRLRRFLGGKKEEQVKVEGI